MSKGVPYSYTNDPEYIKLVEFLVEKTKNVTEPMMAWELGREFKEQSSSDQTIACLRKRIARCISKIHELPNIEINAKVKILFALSAPIDYGFLNKLKENADITLDSFRRIIEYKAKDETLELKGQHKTMKNVRETDKNMVKFLADTAKRIDSPITSSVFLRWFTMASGTSTSTTGLKEQFAMIKKEIYESQKFDMETKIRMLFVSSAELHSYVLEELRCDALVEVDKQNRITKYIANDGSLILEGKHTQYGKCKAERDEFRKISMLLKSSDSGDIEDKEKIKTDEEDDELIKDRSVGTQKLSKKTSYFQNQYLKNGPSTSEKRKTIDEYFCFSPKTPNLNKKRKLGKSISEYDPSERDLFGALHGQDDNFSFDLFQPIETPLKLDPFESVRRSVDAIPEQQESLLVPKLEELTNEFDGPEENVSSLKVLETIHSMVRILELPDLSVFQTEIEKKMETARTSNEMVPIDGFILALDSCTFKLIRKTKNPVNMESICLKDILLITKSVLFTSRITGFDGFLQKLKGMIGSPTVENQSISIEKVQSAFQTALDIMEL